MDMERIRELIEELTGLMDAKKLDELEIEVEGLKVALRRGTRISEPLMSILSPGPMARAAIPGPVEATAAEEHDSEDTHVVRSVMVGTFYRAPAPDADPFVEVGDEVTPDTVVCIIEAMKVMNEVKAEVEGTVRSICADNGEAVEYGQPLFLIARRKS